MEANETIERATKVVDYDDLDWLIGDGVVPVVHEDGLTGRGRCGKTKAFSLTGSGGVFSILRGRQRLIPRREIHRYLRFGPRAEPLVVEE